MGFVHLHSHSAFSLLEGTATPQALVGMAKKLKMPALALTDRNNLYGAVPFYIHAQKAGIKPILGMEVDLDDGASLVLLARNMAGYSNLCHLATVLRLNSDPEAFPPAGFDEDEDDEILPWDPGTWGVPVFGFTGKPARLPANNANATATRPHKDARLPRELLLSGRHARGLIALSGGRRGLVNTLVMQGKMQQAARAAGMLLSAFGEGNFFIEIGALNERDVAALPQLVRLANDLSIPIVAANDVLYLAPEDHQTALALAAARKENRRGAAIFPHEPLIEVVYGHLQGNTELQERVGTERYFKSPEQMAELFKEYPQALANTRFIAEQCNVELPLHKPLFPSVDLHPEETPFSQLWQLCFSGATKRYRPLTEAVIARLKHELEIIESLGFATYFLVVHDIVHFAHTRNIPIMARGSAANSLVAYVLGITQVDPLDKNLLFEQFLNPARAEFSMPDIDLDLCWRRRDEVLHYVYEHYGRDHVAIVGTHITFRLRSAWREMAKVMGIHRERINRIAARLPYLFAAEDIWESAGADADASEVPELSEVEAAEAGDYGPNMTGSSNTSSSASTSTPKFRDEREQMAFELAKTIEGLPRHAGMHCAGVVITPTSIPIADLVPLQRASRDPSMAITQFDKDAVDALGLVKMDLLGSRALTTLVDTLEASGLARARGKEKDKDGVTQALEVIPFDDGPTYEMMASGDTLGCVQLESPGMRGLLKWLRPRNLNDVATAISLFRPGPLEGGFMDTFMRRHLGQEPVEYLHPFMEAILKETNGVILYQEQFLRLVHTLAGLGLGEAEQLRKALGKTRAPEERTRLGSQFVSGAIERGIDQIQAEKVWEIVAGYTGFGFCAAHAHSYALTAYRSAYMKAHYPAHFLAAQINNQGGYYGTSVYVEEARRLGIELLPPSVNESGAWCEVPARESDNRGKQSIRFGLQFVKGLSEKSIAAIVAERLSGGHFHSLMDLISRVDMSPTEVTMLVKVGACDNLGEGGDASIPSIASIQGSMGETLEGVYEPPKSLNRKQMLWLLPVLLSKRSLTAKRVNRQSRTGRLLATGSDGMGLQIAIGGDFIPYSLSLGARGGIGSPKILGNHTLHIDVPSLEEYTPTEKLQLEQEALGFALSHNQMEWLEVPGAVLSGELHRYADREVKVAGIAVAGRRHMGKDGKWMLFLSLQDREGLIEIVLFPDAYHKHGKVLVNGGHGPYVIKGTVQVSGKGRGVGVQPPGDLLPSTTVALKMHPVVIAHTVELLADPPRPHIRRNQL
jgi:DNA-directed DNA polymerase III PolC